MAAQYIPVSPDGHSHLAEGVNEAQKRRKNEGISAAHLSSFPIDENEGNSIPSQMVEGTTVDRPSSSSTGYKDDPADRHPGPSAPPKGSLTSILYNYWFWELALLFLSTVALAAVVVLLVYWDGRPLTQWSSFISLNTFVSTLGTAHKSGLALFIGACLGQQKWNWFHERTDRLDVLETFDEASRGPWGSTKLIYSLLPRWNLSFLAAAVLLISLPFDAFLQATISLHGSMEQSTKSYSNASIGSYSNASIGSYSNASIGRSTNVAVGSLLAMQNPAYEVYATNNSGTVGSDGFVPYPSMGLISAIFNGLDDSPAAQQDKVYFSSCNTGNCTWAVFASAAVCGTCNDVSKYISQTLGDGHTSSQPAVPYVVNDGLNTSFNLTYGSIKNAQGYYQNSSNTQPSILTANVTTDYLESLSFRGINTTFLMVLVMEADPDWISNSVAWENSTPTATECGLSMCVNAYNSSVQSGSLIDEQVASWQNREFDSWRLTEGKGVIYEWWDETYPSFSDYYNLFRSDLQLSIPPSDLARDLNLDTTERFNITQGTIASIQSWIETWGFSGTTDLIVWPTNAENTHPLADVLHDSTDLNRTFTGLASSITNYMRDSSNTTLQGDTQEYVIKFRVRWAFLTVPALHILGGITYVVAIVWQTRNSGLPVWKNRLIPSLAYGLDAAAQDQLRSTHGNLDLASDSIRSRMMITFETAGPRPQLRLSESTGHDEECAGKATHLDQA
ncbi:hypothetical protein LTR13_007145 [Exophiala sideris]|nr:hypothetical protein LTR13_007145 [Exophiala sideris]KAK5186640.1 hypothetical protein LTR44_000646 [Eurotiomycetes sp. CCFEE 6388]